VPGKHPVGEPAESYQADLTGFRRSRRATAYKMFGYTAASCTRTVAFASLLISCQYEISEVAKTLTCFFCTSRTMRRMVPIVGSTERALSS
jgi:hypothetical protein